MTGGRQERKAERWDGEAMIRHDILLPWREPPLLSGRLMNCRNHASS